MSPQGENVLFSGPPLQGGMKTVYLPPGDETPSQTCQKPKTSRKRVQTGLTERLSRSLAPLTTPSNLVVSLGRFASEADPFDC